MNRYIVSIFSGIVLLLSLGGFIIIRPATIQEPLYDVATASFSNFGDVILLVAGIFTYILILEILMKKYPSRFSIFEIK